MVKLDNFQKNDLDQVCNLFLNIFNAEPWNETWTFETVNRKILELQMLPNSILLVAKVINTNNIVGFLAGHYETFHDGKSFFLKEICVDRKWQNKHIGKKLLIELENQLISFQVSSIYLLTMKNSISEIFYKKNNYKTSQLGCIMKKYIIPNKTLEDE